MVFVTVSVIFCLLNRQTLIAASIHVAVCLFTFDFAVFASLPRSLLFVFAIECHAYRKNRSPKRVYFNSAAVPITESPRNLSCSRLFSCTFPNERFNRAGHVTHLPPIARLSREIQCSLALSLNLRLGVLFLS